MLHIIKNPKMTEKIIKADKIGLYISALKTQKGSSPCSQLIKSPKG
jgi:hypothetical protein